MKNFEILCVDKSHLKRVSMPARSIDDLIQLVSKPNDDLYGANNWLITPADNLPSDFSTDTYTIVDGELVRLPDEVIAEREAAALRAAEQAATAAEIARLKEYLTATDWAVVKCLEIGAPLAEIYPDMATERGEARTSINQLEKGGVE